MSKEQRYTLKLIIIGIAVFFAVASVPVLIFTKDRFKCEAGLFIGSVMAMQQLCEPFICLTYDQLLYKMAWHMSFSISRSVYMEKHQSAFLAWSSVGRLVTVAGIIVLIAWTRFANPIFMVLGMLGLKFGAYFAPILEKRFKIKIKE